MANMDDRYDYGRYDYADYDDDGGSAGGFIAGALTGAVLASAITWLLDPQSGQQRRTLVREKASTAYQRSRAGIGTASERARGYAQQGRERFDRIRTTARGAVDSARNRASSAMNSAGGRSNGEESTYGSSYDEGGAGAYGDSSSSRGRASQWMHQAQDMMQGGQASRVATGAAGLGLAGLGLSRRGPIGLALGALGLYLVATAAKQKSGSTVQSGIQVQNDVTIDRPVHEVYAYLQDIERWPQFMQHVQEITTIGDRRSHWRVEGPAGVTAEWDAETTEQVPNERICWRTLPGSMVDSEGSLELENDGSGGTRVRLWMIYSPPAGAAGHVVAKLFRRDPQTESTHDLQNLKQAIESGQAGTSSGTSGASGSPMQGSTYSSH